MSDLEKLHLALLYIANEIDRVCNKNNIKYTLVGGSLIGAIRHKGFIPWDDDIDLGMTRDNYQKFISACSKDLGSEFELQTYLTDPNYNYGFAKILLRGTDVLELGHEDTKEKKGIFVDIFPFDAVPENNFLKLKHEKINYALIKLLQQKTGIRANKKWRFGKKVVFFILNTVSKVFSRDFLVKKLQSNMIRYNEISNPSKLVNLSGVYGYKKETVNAKCFDEYISSKYETTNLMISRQYDEYLRSVFGDYMKLPPVEKRKTHEFKKLNFGTYDFGE